MMEQSNNSTQDELKTTEVLEVTSQEYGQLKGNSFSTDGASWELPD